MAFCRRYSCFNIDLLTVLMVLTWGVTVALSLTIPPMPNIPFEEQYNVVWNPSNVKLSADGHVLLTMDQRGGSGFASNKEYLYGYVSVALKLIPGDSSGIVTAFYLSSDQKDANHDELDFEFLGNKSGEPYILQTNVFADGVGGREQRIFLWFDPREDFHTYSILWNRGIVVFSIDGIPIRSFKSDRTLGIQYPHSKPMRAYMTMWDGESWATRGGQDKIDWSEAPFSATCKNFVIDACDGSLPKSTDSATLLENGDAVISLSSSSNPKIAKRDVSCATVRRWWTLAKFRGLTVHMRNQLRFVKRRYMIYDYCRDASRYPVPPPECAIN